RRESHGTDPAPLFLCRVVYRVWREPARRTPRLVTVAGQLEAALPILAARVRLERRAARSSFQLDIDIEVPAGITVLFGPSGAGKSTLLDCIAGLLHPDEGRVAVGETLVFDSSAGVNLAPQKRGV